MPGKPACTASLTVSPGRAFGMRLVLSLFAANGARAVSPSNPPASHLIGNAAVELVIERQGAVITTLRPAGTLENWLATSAQMFGNERYGHFLCFDRWGPVTAAAEAAGVPFHGEAGLIPWDWVRLGRHETIQSVQLPVHCLRAERQVCLVDDSGVFVLRNTFENPTPVTRAYNAAEHATLSRRWTDKDVRLYTNAQRGFLTFDSIPIPNSVFVWPMARYDGRDWDLRGDVTMGVSAVASLVFPDKTEWAWVCLVNPRTREALGYVWRTRDYPWLDLWWQAVNGEVLNRSVEPATTGLNATMPVLQAARTKLGRPVFCALTPGEKRTLRVWGFALRLPFENARLRTIQVEKNDIRLEFAQHAKSIVLPMQPTHLNHE